MKAPVNSKSLFAFICDQMEKLSSKEITVDEAKAQSNLATQATKVLRYEIDRSETEMRVRKFNMENGSHIEIRQVESKGFDDTTK